MLVWFDCDQMRVVIRKTMNELKLLKVKGFHIPKIFLKTISRSHMSKFKGLILDITQINKYANWLKVVTNNSINCIEKYSSKQSVA